MNEELETSLRWYDEGNRIVPFEYYPPKFEYTNAEVLLHWHTGTEITYITEGSANYFINGEKIVSQAGDIIFIPPNTLHSVTGIDQISETLVFHLNLIGLEINDYSAINYLEPFQKGKIKTIYCIRKKQGDYQKIAQLVQDLFSCIKKEEPYFELKLKSLLLSFFHELFISDTLRFAEKPLESYLENQKIKELLHYLDQNLDQKLQISDLAAFCNYSKSYFMNFFRRNVGMSCIDYLNSLRIKKAETLLKNSNDPITEIALQVGFNNQSNFNRLFKIKLGMTPSDYRKLFQ